MTKIDPNKYQVTYSSNKKVSEKMSVRKKIKKMKKEY